MATWNNCSGLFTDLNSTLSTHSPQNVELPYRSNWCTERIPTVDDDKTNSEERTQRFYLKYIYHKHALLQRTFVSCLRSWESGGSKRVRRRQDTAKHSCHGNRKTSCHVTKETMKRVGQAPDALMTARKGNWEQHGHRSSTFHQLGFTVLRANTGSQILSSFTFQSPKMDTYYA